MKMFTKPSCPEFFGAESNEQYLNCVLRDKMDHTLPCPKCKNGGWQSDGKCHGCCSRDAALALRTMSEQ